MEKRRSAREINIGGITIGGKNPVAIQSMCTTKTHNIRETLAQIKKLKKEGCEIIRVTVPFPHDAEALPEIVKKADMPVVADIHYDYRMAIASIKNGAHKIRINPGNIGKKEWVEEIIKVAKKYKTPIRIGVNAGSLEKELWAKYRRPSPEALVESALNWIQFFEERNFHDMVIALKSSRVPEMIQAYELIAKKCDYPLHLGVTEAGTMLPGSVKSAIGIGTLLYRGIGDTIRVSLAEDPVEEIKVCKEILKSLELYQKERTIIACPTCGRVEVDLLKLAHEVEKRTAKIHLPIRIAVMGCVVNGPGESREADYGIAGGKGAGAIYRKGKMVKTAPEKDLLKELLAVIQADYPKIKL
ncbi:MAG: flavodoxin-dependent (E)-4-hydroxy-3-methylbut-2-enyl-diphosphate synthase [Patescibacteria group bacterium]